MGKHLGNTKETLTMKISRTFPHLRIQGTYVLKTQCKSHLNMLRDQKTAPIDKMR